MHKGPAPHSAVEVSLFEDKYLYTYVKMLDFFSNLFAEIFAHLNIYWKETMWEV